MISNKKTIKFYVFVCFSLASQASPTIKDDDDEPKKSSDKQTSDSDQKQSDESGTLKNITPSISNKKPNEPAEINKPGPPREKGNVEYFILIYLHDDPLNESQHKQLRNLVNFIKIFDDDDDCFAFIKKIYNEKIILIIENSFVKYIINKIEKLQQIYSIYILTNKEHRDDLIDNNSKIRGYYTDIKELYQPISTDINKLTRDLIVYLNTSSYSSKMEPVILYYLLLNEIILDKTDIKNSLTNLIKFSRKEYEENDDELKLIDEFENTYKKEDAITWFSKSCFISKVN